MRYEICDDKEGGWRIRDCKVPLLDFAGLFLFMIVSSEGKVQYGCRHTEELSNLQSKTALSCFMI